MLFVVASAFPAVALAKSDNPLLGYWNSTGGENVVKIRKNPSGVIEGRLIKVTDAAAKLGYQENDVVIKAVSVNQRIVEFKTAIRHKNPDYKKICGVRYLNFKGQISEDLTEISGKRQAGGFEVTKDGNDKPTGCSFAPADGTVSLSYTRNSSYQPKIKIITFNNSESLAIGDLFLVQIELKEETSEQSISARVEIGDKNIELTARRISDYPAVFESDPIEVTWKDSSEPWPSIHAGYHSHVEKAAINGWTADAYLHLIQHLLTKAPTEKNILAAVQNAERIYELARTTKNPSIWRFTAAGLDAIAKHTVAKEVFETFAHLLMADFNSHANKKLRAYLDKAHPDIKSQDNNLRQSLVLLREAAFINALKKLYDLNRYKQGSGKVTSQSFVALSSQEALSKLQKIPSRQLDEFLLMNGVANNKAVRKKLRQHLLDRSKSLYRYLADAAYRIEISKNALGLHGLADLVNFNDYDQDRLPGSLRNIRDNILKYDSLLSAYPLLGVKVKDTRSFFGAKQPLWRVLGRTDTGRTDRQVEQYVDRALANAETALRDMLRKVSAMKTPEKLLELGSPRYKKLQEMAGANFGSNYGRSLVSYARGKYVEENASDYFWELVWDDALTVVQVGGTLLPPVAVGATAIKVAIKGRQTVAAFEEIDNAEMTNAAGFGGHDAVLKAQDKFHSRVSDLSFEVVFGFLDVTAALEYKAFKALKAARAAGNVSEDVVKNTIKRSSEEIEKELALYQKFYDDIKNRKRITGDHLTYAKKTRDKINSIDDKITAAVAEGKADRIVKLNGDRAKKIGTLQRHLARLKSSKEKLAKLLKDGPKFPGSGKGPRYLQQGHDVEKGATVTFWRAMVRRFPKYVTESADGAFHYGKIEFRFKGMIADENGNLLRQKPTVSFYEEIDGQLVKKSTQPNPHVGKRMEYDRIIIDHTANGKKIYLEDIVRSPNKRHLKKTFGYFEGLKTMFKKELTQDGYQLALPKDVHYGQMQNPFNAVTPSGSKYKVVNGKSYID